MEKYSQTYNVILDDMDMENYRLRPISAITYVQDAFARYTATKRRAAYDLFPKNLYWVIGEFNMEFVDDSPFWSEEIKVEVWFSEFTKLKMWTDFKIYYKDKIFVKGNACWFLINTLTKRPNKTDIVSEVFEISQELTLGEHKKFEQPELKEKYSQTQHTINLLDIDFNKHTNNKSYLTLAETTIPYGFKADYTLKKLSVRFNRESFLGDVLNCNVYKTSEDNKYIHKIVRMEKDENAEQTEICDIITKWEEKLQKETASILYYDLDIKNFRV